MAYLDEFGDVEGDLEDRLDHAWQIGYRQAIDAVLAYLEDWNSEPRDVRKAIEDRII